MENYRADVMQKLQLGYEKIKTVNPKIIYLSMPGHGKTGPESGYVDHWIISAINSSLFSMRAAAVE